MRIFVLFAVLFSVLPLVASDVVPRPLENPPTKQQIHESIGRGIHFLIQRQNLNGSWGSAQQTKELNIYAPGSSHDAYRAGTTALDLSALLETEAASKQKYHPFKLDDLGVDEGKFTAAIDLAERWMVAYMPKLRRSSEDCLYNIWGHAYGIQALVRMLHRFPDDKARCEKIRAIIEQQVDFLRRFETLSGGWFYYDTAVTQHPSETTASFCSATVLIALKEAEREGIAIPPKMINTTMKSLKRQRLPDFAYLYGEYLWERPRLGINRPAGSLGRSQACNLAMKRWGDDTVTDDILINWLDRLYARNGWLDVGRKRPIPHESFFQVAGYFFYYAHYYAALCIEELPEKNQAKYKEYLADVLVKLQEKDGSWWDYPLYNYHQQYGTGFAVQSLLRTL